MMVLARGRVHIAALCVGMAQRALEESVAYAAVNKQGNRPIGEYQLVQALLAESYTEILAGRTMTLEVARNYDAGEDIAVGPSAAKLYCAEMVGRVADRGVQIHGAKGYMRTTPIERSYRDVRLFRIYEGTSEVQKLVIGRSLVREAHTEAASGGDGPDEPSPEKSGRASRRSPPAPRRTRRVPWSARPAPDTSLFPSPGQDRPARECSAHRPSEVQQPPPGRRAHAMSRRDGPGRALGRQGRSAAESVELDPPVPRNRLARSLVERHR